MAGKSQRKEAARSLSVGNIVTIALQASRVNGGSYLLTSLLIHGVLLVLLLGAGIVAVLATVATAVVNDQPLLLGMTLGVAVLVVSAIAFLAFGSYFAGGAILSRLVLQVIQRQPEPTVPTAQRIFRQTWRYTQASLWLGLVSLLCYLVLGLIAGLLLYVLYVLGQALVNSSVLPSEINFVVRMTLILLVLLVILGFLIAAYYITARLLFVDIILAVEPGMRPLRSLNRSWELTQGQAMPILTILFIYTVIVTPPTLLATLANIIVPAGSFALTVGLLIVWQALKAVMYYDLRHHNEGLDFDLHTVPALPERFLRRVALQTPESVELDFMLGGIGSRAFAWVVDRAIVFFSLALLGLIAAFIYFYALLPLVVETLRVDVDTLNLWVLAIAILIYFIVINGYFIAFETVWSGQTPGKRLARIRVVCDNGQPIGLREATLRSLLALVDFALLFVGAFLIAFSHSEKRLGDMVAGTLVIQDQQNQQNLTSGFIEQDVTSATQTLAQTLSSQGKIKALSADQYVTIREFLQYQGQLQPLLRAQIAAKLASQAQAILTFEEQLLEVTAREFLQAVYLAYSAQTIGYDM